MSDGCAATANILGAVCTRGFRVLCYPTARRKDCRTCAGEYTIGDFVFAAEGPSQEARQCQDDYSQTENLRSLTTTTLCGLWSYEGE